MLRRHYRCGDCGMQFTEMVDNKSVPLRVDCPECAKPSDYDAAGEKAAADERIQKMLDSGIPPGKRTNVSRAVDIAHRMSEEDFGLTDMNDSGRKGEIAAKAPAPMQSREVQEIAREFVQAGMPEAMAPELADQARNFWQPTPATANATIAGAARAAAAARADGVDPVGLLHEAGKKGILKPRYDVVSRAKMDVPGA